MEIKEQILSIKQIKELEKLGFDVNKHSSLKSNGEQIIIKDDFYIGGAPLFPMMTIGDIISVLPVIIKDEYFLSVNSEYCTYSMIEGLDTIFYTQEKELINNLFKTLVWCIKNKYIAL
ncbi:MAG: hypothetical protein M0R46_15170 [Candidatus Muirbacterium halophilum]|nr:hypothetical protein [Candidatus Muirbacterium halophilum]